MFLSATTWLILRLDSARSFLGSLKEEQPEQTKQENEEPQEQIHSLVTILASHCDRIARVMMSEVSGNTVADRTLEFLLGSFWLLFYRNDEWVRYLFPSLFFSFPVFFQLLEKITWPVL